MSQVKSIHMRKRKALADLFKYLATLGKCLLNQLIKNHMIWIFNWFLINCKNKTFFVICLILNLAFSEMYKDYEISYATPFALLSLGNKLRCECWLSPYPNLNDAFCIYVLIYMQWNLCRWPYNVTIIICVHVPLANFIDYWISTKNLPF